MPYETQSASFDALPTTPRARLDSTRAVPQAAAKELGDYAEGHYAVSVKTQDAPSMDESCFAQVSRDQAARA